jgi:hypothetical protein
MQPSINWSAVEAIAEVVSAIATAMSVIYLAIQTRNASRQAQEAIIHSNKQTMEATIRSEWAVLHAERQRLESDMTQTRIHGGAERIRSAREKQLDNRIKEVSGYMTKMLEDHPGVFPNLAYFTLQGKQDKPD